MVVQWSGKCANAYSTVKYEFGNVFKIEITRIKFILYDSSNLWDFYKTDINIIDTMSILFVINLAHLARAQLCTNSFYEHIY